MIPSLRILLLLLLVSAAASSQGDSYHTSPARWSEPRSFQTSFEPKYEERLVLDHGIDANAEPLVFSPNRSYWLAGGRENEWKLDPSGEIRSGTESPEASLFIHTERDSLLVVRIHDRYPNYYVSARWVSEKLVFIRVFWGRVLGTDAIIDVERGEFVYREMVNDGVNPFLQFTQERKVSGGAR
jgi:hypothetical protein